MTLSASFMKRFCQLPEDIQNNILEYNAEHRPLLKKCHREFFQTIFNPCLYCLEPCQRDLFCSIDYFINQKYKMSSYWCSSRCFREYDNHKVKITYLLSVEKFLCLYSLQYKNGAEWDEYELSIMGDNDI